MTEICLALMVSFMAAAVLYNGLSAFVVSWQRLQSELLLNRAARYSRNFIAQELLLYAGNVKITSGKGDKIVCGEIRGNRQVTFYRNSGTLAREIKYNSTRGVNPLSLEEVTLVDLQAEQAADDKIKVTFIFKDNKTGFSKEFTEVYAMANGGF